MTGRYTRWERWLPGSGGRLKVLNCNLHMFHIFRNSSSSFVLNILGPLCLWQCLFIVYPHVTLVKLNCFMLSFRLFVAIKKVMGPAVVFARQKVDNL